MFNPFVHLQHNYGKEIRRIREENERERVRLREAELEMLQNLEEAAKLSRQRLQGLNKDQVGHLLTEKSLYTVCCVMGSKSVIISNSPY